MSAGHRHNEGGGQSSQVIDRFLANPEFLAVLWRPRETDRTYDLPYLGGTSVDDSKIYFDRHLPEKLAYHQDGKKHEFNPCHFIHFHECFERGTMDVIGWDYAHAHQAATGYERRKVISAGLSWPDYNRAVEKYVKASEHEKIKKVPPDLDMRPYYAPPVNKKLVARMQECMGTSEGKKSKSEVDYSEGMAKSHCGPVSRWSNGECEHFQTPNGCALVRGWIDPKYWCKLWEKSDGD
jgi:hypothetical protein